MGLRREGRDGWGGSAAGIIHSFIHSSRVSIDRRQTNARGYGTMTDGGRRGVRVDGSLGKSTHRPWFLNHPALAASLRTRVAVTDDGLESFFKSTTTISNGSGKKLPSVMTAMHTDQTTITYFGIFYNQLPPCYAKLEIVPRSSSLPRLPSIGGGGAVQRPPAR